MPAEGTQAFRTRGNASELRKLLPHSVTAQGAETEPRGAPAHASIRAPRLPMGSMKTGCGFLSESSAASLSSAATRF